MKEINPYLLERSTEKLWRAFKLNARELVKVIVFFAS